MHLATAAVLHTADGVPPAWRGSYGLYHLAILLPDRSALGRFAAHVASLNLRLGMADHLVSEALYLWDPDRLGIEVYADRPREMWQRRDGELVMTTGRRSGVILAPCCLPEATTIISGRTSGHRAPRHPRMKPASSSGNSLCHPSRTCWRYREIFDPPPTPLSARTTI
jgi:hypothetical protein